MICKILRHFLKNVSADHKYSQPIISLLVFFFFTYFKSRNFVNTFTANDKYSLFNRNNLEQPIQILISEKQKNFLSSSLNFLNLHQILNISKKKMTLIVDVFPKIQILKTWLDNCLRSTVSEDPSTSNTVNFPKHC